MGELPTGLNTKDVVTRFIQTYLLHNNHPGWRPSWAVTVRKSPKLTEVCDSLTKISNQLEDFIRESYKETFEQTTMLDLQNLDYDHVRILADELFDRGISWSRIVTFLTYGAALCSKALEFWPDNTEGFEMVSEIVTMIIRYIDENLLAWIGQQDADWLSVTKDSSIKHKPETRSFQNKSLINMAAVAVLMWGIIYSYAKS